MLRELVDFKSRAELEVYIRDQRGGLFLPLLGRLQEGVHLPLPVHRVVKR